MEVSADGKSMHVVDEDQLDGLKITYTRRSSKGNGLTHWRRGGGGGLWRGRSLCRKAVRRQRSRGTVVSGAAVGILGGRQ